jgi:Ca-activated chloride channel family protein
MPSRVNGRGWASQVLPRPKNVRALAVTLAFAVVVVGLIIAFPPPCHVVVVASSNEKYELVRDIAAKYQPGPVERRCVRIQVTQKASGEAEAALARGWDENSDGPRPHVWSPAATTWALLLQQHLAEATPRRLNLIPPLTPPLMLSPLVIGMPRVMAEALVAERGLRGIGWVDLFALAREPTGWAALRRPDWGPFALGKTNPNFSTSGFHALLATYHAATGASEPPTLADLQRAEVIEFARGVESGVLHYANSVGDFLENLYERDQRGEALKYVSALPVEEKQLFEYNRGNPTSDWPPKNLPRPNHPLVSVYPAEGTLAANHPYIVLTAPWVSSAHVQAAEDFFAHLSSPAVQQRFCAEGFRNQHGVWCGPPDAGVQAGRPGAYLQFTDSRVIAQAQRSWSIVRKKAQVLLAIDVGGSMSAFLPSLGQTKLDLAKDAAIEALRRRPLAPDDEVGLWVYSTDLDGERAYRVIVPLTRVDRGLEDLIGAIRGLQPVSRGKGLYSTVLACMFDIRTRDRPDRINAVVLLTDGRNDDARNDDKEAFLNILRNQSDEQRVRVFTIALGGADEALLKEIARESGGLYYDAADPAKIKDVFRDVISNF